MELNTKELNLFTLVDSELSFPDCQLLTHNFSMTGFAIDVYRGYSFITVPLYFRNTTPLQPGTTTLLLLATEHL